MLDEIRWNNLMAKLGLSRTSNDPFDRLVEAYAEPHRHYHTAGHIAHCLREFDASRHLATHPDEVEFALWLHDVVYDPKAQDNEEQSAHWVVELLSACGCEAEVTARIENLILATKQHAASSDPDTRLLLDIDLSILGQPVAVYDQYESAVRAEYSWVPEPAYKTGRRKVLRSFADQPRIFQTDRFYDLYEQTARSNLQRALSVL